MQSIQTFSVAGYPSSGGPAGNGVYGRHLTAGAPPSYRGGPAVTALSLTLPNLAADTVALRVDEAVGTPKDYRVGTIVAFSRDKDTLTMTPISLNVTPTLKNLKWISVLVSVPVVCKRRGTRASGSHFACNVTAAVQNAVTVHIPPSDSARIKDLATSERFTFTVFDDSDGTAWQRNVTVLERYNAVLETMRCDLGGITCMEYDDDDAYADGKVLAYTLGGLRYFVKR